MNKSHPYCAVKASNKVANRNGCPFLNTFDSIEICQSILGLDFKSCRNQTVKML